MPEKRSGYVYSAIKDSGTDGMTGRETVLCATVSVKTHRQGIPCRHDGKGMKQGDEGVLVLA